MDYGPTDRFVVSAREFAYRAAVIGFVLLWILGFGTGFGAGIFSRSVKQMPERATHSQPTADVTREALPQAKSRSLPRRS